MSALLKLLRFAKPYRGLALASLVMLVAMVATDLSIPRLVERVIDDGVLPGRLAVVVSTSLAMLCVSLAGMAVAVLNSNWSIRVGEGVARALREAVFARIMGFSHADLDRFPTGALMVRLASDTAAVQRVVQVTLRIGTRAPLTMLGAIVLMFATSSALAWSMVPILLAALALIGFFGGRMEPLFRAAQRKLDRLNVVLQESIAGTRLVKAFARADRETARFGAANDELAAGTVRVMEYMSAMGPALTLLVNLGMVLVVRLGGARAMDGALSLGRLVAFTNYLLATLHPLVVMTQLANTWANGLASAKRVNEILELPESLPEAAGPRDLPGSGASAVSLRDVVLRYDGGGGLAALEGVSLEARSGETVAVLGATGSGKSTLVNLVPRFRDVDSGYALVDGVDVREARKASLLSRVAVVPQETVLFSGTMRDNIRYGRPDASDGEVVAAAKAAEAHAFILELPGGYEARVEQRGANLSGGQRQRIAIARALLVKPAILVLDDATSAVDVETETRIQRNLARFAKDCTLLVVAQRVSTVLDADRIAVLDQGRLVAEGTHAELLASSPVYREIFDSQLGGGIHA